MVKLLAIIQVDGLTIFNTPGFDSSAYKISLKESLFIFVIIGILDILGIPLATTWGEVIPL
jgi:hypothetical protein